MQDVLMRPAGLVCLCALSYAIATAGMKAAAESVSLAALLVVAIGFTLAMTAEILLLRQTNLGVAYLTVLAVETLLVLLLAVAIGEGLNARQIFGAGAVMAGLALVGCESGG